MKSQKLRNTFAAAMAVLTTFALAPSAGARVVDLKVGDSCTKAQYGKTVKAAGNFYKCVYSSKTKKYSWNIVASSPTTAPPIDLAKLDKKGWPSKFVVGGVPAENSTTMQTKWGGLVKLFQDELGIPVEFYAGTSYAGVIEASIANKVDMVAWGAMSYIVAKLNGAKIEPMGITKYADSTTYYTSRLITGAGRSDINGISDLKGKKVCFVSSTSTSGSLIPTEGILSAGLTTKDMTQIFAGSHDNSLLKLGSGDCEASFMQEATWNAIGTGTFAAMKKADYKEVWKSAPIPNGPFSIRSSLPASFKAAVKNILLTKLTKDYFVSKGYNGCTAVATCVIVEDANTVGFLEVQDSFYDSIRKVCEATKSTACKA
jgi:phosphonate transport system substrate-binding protein